MVFLTKKEGGNMANRFFYYWDDREVEQEKEVLVGLTAKLIENTENLELDQLTTSQAVAQYVKQVTSQIQQQKLTTQKKTNLSQKPSEKK
ncbi:10991_t:CDS:2 [Entrophospora sp. SA101]|nr:10991_t:CDS:2 [Entrophospora sp. SA101]